MKLRALLLLFAAAALIHAQLDPRIFDGSGVRPPPPPAETEAAEGQEAAETEDGSGAESGERDESAAGEDAGEADAQETGEEADPASAETENPASPPEGGSRAVPGRATEVFRPTERIGADQAVDFPWDI